jgi:hypothetical protein
MRGKVLVLSSLLAVGGCSDNVEGEIRIGKVDVFAPFDCINGNELGFAGVEMWDEEGRLAHFVRFGGDSALIFLTPDYVEYLRVDTQSCPRFDGALRGRSWGSRRGHVSVHCIASTGRSVDGALQFRGCGSIDDDDGWDDDDLWDDDC